MGAVFVSVCMVAGVMCVCVCVVGFVFTVGRNKSLLLFFVYVRALLVGIFTGTVTRIVVAI